jgi:hypothetical protein
VFAKQKKNEKRAAILLFRSCDAYQVFAKHKKLKTRYCNSTAAEIADSSFILKRGGDSAKLSTSTPLRP